MLEHLRDLGATEVRGQCQFKWPEVGHLGQQKGVIWGGRVETEDLTDRVLEAILCNISSLSKMMLREKEQDEVTG